MNRMEQLLAFCDWERKHNPHPEGKPHVAEWAADEIERLQALLAMQKASYEREIAIDVAAERERCAKLCRDYAAQTAITDFQRHTAKQLAAAIEGPNVGIEPPYSVGSNDGLGPL